MNAKRLRQYYLDFFESKAHLLFPSGSLIPYDVTGKLDESLLFNGAGMVQFKPYFRGVMEPPSKRLVSAQKCVRTGDIECVGDPSHLTFFEMLGNFSFGDYFKEDAISYAWEFLTSSTWLGLDPRYFCCTVFKEDEESYEIWASYWKNVGFDPINKIFKLGEDTNYWPAGAYSSGPPGPCGPNTEIFYWTASEDPPTGPYTREDYLKDEKAGKWLEIWNLVFIQYEWQGHLKDSQKPHLGYEKKGMPSLPFKSIDTGMGLERAAAVLAGHGSVYNTDVFSLILCSIEPLAKGSLKYGVDAEKDQAMRIIADHARTACLCIADGILPGNNGRGYVLRRLIRRAILKGQRVLGIEEPFFYKVYQGVCAALSDPYTELLEREEVILETLHSEEISFRKTLVAGSHILQSELALLQTGSILSGEIAFKLYDTYGFPFEVTSELCEEIGVAVDQEGYEQALKEAQERSRSSAGMETVYGGLDESYEEISLPNVPALTPFLGYQQLAINADIVRIRWNRLDNDLQDFVFEVCLDQTSFYAESGGQVGDQGVLKGRDFTLQVLETRKKGGTFWHKVRFHENFFSVPLSELKIEELLKEKLLGTEIQAIVDPKQRRSTECNHTATHLLHAALRQVLGKHVTQAGSLVAPTHLRFDFTHGKAISQEELFQIEKIVNEQVLKNSIVQTWEDIPIEEAKAKGAMALFGEKYSDRVRMVQVDHFSLELCGGTHLPQTGHIGLFKILHESSAASGVRRIEAITAEHAYYWVKEQAKLIENAASLLKSQPQEIHASIERLLTQQKDLQKRLDRARLQQTQEVHVKFEPVGPVELAVQLIEEGDLKEATLIADRLVENRPAHVVIVGLLDPLKPALICKIGKEAERIGIHAGEIVRELAMLAGGGGGGKPGFATAGAKDAESLKKALKSAKNILQSQLKIEAH